MPRFESSDIAHTAVTDHRILRTQENAERGQRKPRGLRPGEIPLVNFFEKELNPQDPAVSRDYGLALIYSAAQAIPGRQAIGSRALTLLDKALQSSPDDAAAWEAKGCAFSLQGRIAEAMAAVETALARAPQRESTLEFAAELAEKMDRPSDAIAYLRRLCAVNPWMWEYRYTLSKLLAKRQEWQNALDECEAALRLNPANEAARILLIVCCLRCGKRDRARSEFQTLLALNPKEERALRSWFAEQMP
jgi:tetratricopeptide (TPR) repeat protein